jgi:hypothetical protein
MGSIPFPTFAASNIRWRHGVMAAGAFPGLIDKGLTPAVALVQKGPPSVVRLTCARTQE